MSVWLTIPSARPAAECNEILGEWTRCGYDTAVLRDPGAGLIDSGWLIIGTYVGYAAAINHLCHVIHRAYSDNGADWFVIGGDDVHPVEGRHANDIAAECTEHFHGTYGVMQATGDRWGSGGEVFTERACTSAWIGREFIERAYGGKGPLHDGYFHFFVDQELKEVAETLSILWQRPDLAQFHDNWQRTPGNQRPVYLEKAVAHHAADKALFEVRKAAGFPGHQPA